MTLTPLDPEYAIEVPVDDSPFFHDLVQHWRGDAETVVDMEQHYYEEVIQLTETKRTVVTIQATDVKLQYKVDEDVQTAAMLRYNKQDIDATMQFMKTPVEDTFEVPFFNDAKIEDTVTGVWETWFREEEAQRSKKKYFRKTRTFFSLVAMAFKEARSS